MKTIQQLLNNLSGQIAGINRMIESGKNCSDVIIQMKAVRSGLNKIQEKYIMENMEKCIKKDKTKDVNKLVSELIKN